MKGACSDRIQSPGRPISDTIIVALPCPRGCPSVGKLVHQPNISFCLPKKRGSLSRSAAALSFSATAVSPSSRAISNRFGLARTCAFGARTPLAFAAAS